MLPKTDIMNSGPKLWKIPSNPWIIHLCAWLVILFLPPFAIWRINIATSPMDYVMLFALPVAIIAIFYFNYLFLIDRLLLKGKTLCFILCNLAIVAILLASVYSLPIIFNWETVRRPPFPAIPGNRGTPDIRLPIFPPDPMRFISGDAIFCLLSIGIACAIKMTRNWSNAEKKRQELEKENIHAELNNLKSQLNPHFLFNSLNNIYSFVETNPEMARIAIENLCGMLRYALYKSNSKTVPFSNEVQFLKGYINLACIRATEDMEISISLPDSPSDIPIAPMLFISPVENALKHGICPGEKSAVEIRLEEKDGRVVCSTRNTMHIRPCTAEDTGGIGIENLKKRLDIMYKGKYNFKYGVSGNMYCTLLIIDTK